jgi:outer membrane protein TolC
MHRTTARRLIALLILALGATAASGQETMTPAGAERSGGSERLDGAVPLDSAAPLDGGEAVGEPEKLGDTRQLGSAEQLGAPDFFAGVERLELAHLVAAVLDRNPSLDAARQAWRAAVERVPQAISWADPMVAAGVAPLSIGGDMPFGATVEARQRLPYPGRLRLAGDVARAEAAGAESEIDLVALDLTHLAADLYHRLYLVERSQEVNTEHLRLLGELQETATTRYAAGLVPQQAPLAAEVELTHLLHREIGLATERHVVVARLNALLHRPAAAPLPPAGEPPERQAEPAPVVVAGHDGHAAAPAALAAPGTLPPRPELAAVAAEIEARRLEVELAELARYPDLDLMTSYSSMFGGDHRWMLGVAVELPVRRARLRAAEAEAAARLAAAQSRRQALADEVRAEVEAAALHLAHTAHVLELYRDRLVPASRDQMRAARSGFESGQVDVDTVLDAERNLRDVELTAIEARIELSRAERELERALGRLPGAPEPILPAAADGTGSAPDSATDTTGGSR